MTTFTIKLNPTWPIPNDASVARNPTTKISFDTTKIFTPECMNPIDNTQFTNIALTGGDSLPPVVIITKPVAEIPLCAQSIQLSAGMI